MLSLESHSPLWIHFASQAVVFLSSVQGSVQGHHYSSPYSWLDLGAWHLCCEPQHTRFCLAVHHLQHDASALIMSQSQTHTHILPCTHTYTCTCTCMHTWYTHVFIYACICVHAYACMHTIISHTHTHAHTHTPHMHTHTHTHTHIRTHTRTRMHARTYTCMHACTHTRTYTRTHARTHARTHTHLSLSFLSHRVFLFSYFMFYEVRRLVITQIKLMHHTPCLQSTLLIHFSKELNVNILWLYFHCHPQVWNSTRARRFKKHASSTFHHTSSSSFLKSSKQYTVSKEVSRNCSNL